MTERDRYLMTRQIEEMLGYVLRETHPGFTIYGYLSSAQQKVKRVIYEMERYNASLQ